MKFERFENVSNGVKIGEEVETVTGVKITDFGFKIYYSNTPLTTVFKSATINGVVYAIDQVVDVVIEPTSLLAVITLNLQEYGNILEGYKDFTLTEVKYTDGTLQEYITVLDPGVTDTLYYGNQTVEEVIADINIFTTEDDVIDEVFDLINTCISEVNLWLNTAYPLCPVNSGNRDFSYVMPISRIIVDTLIKEFCGFEVRRKETEDDVQQVAFLDIYKANLKKVKQTVYTPDKYKDKSGNKAFGRPNHSPQYYYKGYGSNGTI